MPPLPGTTTFRGRLTWRWTLAVGLLLAAANLTIYGAARTYLHAWLDGHLRTLAATEAASSTDGLEDVHLHEKPFSQFDAGAFTEKLVQIYDGNRALVLQTTGLETLAPIVSDEVVGAALEGRAPLVSTQVHGRSVRVAVVRAMRDARPFAIAVGLFTDEIANGLANLTLLLGAVWLVGVAATATIGYVLAGRTLAPVARITERAAWIAQGNFGARLDPPNSPDEVGRMTLLLNSMLDRLQSAVETNRRFAADASHELRAPLTAMAGEIDVTLRHPRQTDEYRDTLIRVRARIEQLTRLAGDLMLLVRAQERTHDIVRREIPLDTMVAESFHRLAAPASRRGITLRQEGTAGVRVYAEPGLFARVLDNVLANAVHHNREGGEVVVSAEAEVPLAGDGEWVVAEAWIRVRDSGPGIPADQHERIFERFHRLDRSRARQTGGSGLGLAICREVLALHGGSIAVERSSDEGTTFLIRLAGQRTAASTGQPASAGS